MASINASTSGAGGVITTADATGTLQLQSGGTTIATISSTGITTQVGAPAFSAYQSSAQTLSNATFTKMLFQTEEFDTNSNFASSTFTPTVAGYYQISTFIYFGNAVGNNITSIYKNGGNYKRLNNSPSTAAAGSSGGSCLVYCNGTTDYIEVYGYQTQGSNLTIPFALSDLVYFQAAMVRSA
jgi:hypothetical protein